MTWLCALLPLLIFAEASAKVDAQTVTPLVQFTNVWKYNQDGLELGTAWRTNDYDDAAWPQGQGLLGFEDVITPYAVHAPLRTQLTVSSAVTTFFFRTTFHFTDPIANGLSLIATNLVDDGCVIYLNGLIAGGVRVQQGYNANTFFAGPAVEGQLDVVTLTNLAALRQGLNVLAVEVHQSATTSADVMWGMRLMAVQQTAFAITNQPRGQFVSLGDSVTLTVGVSGGPAYYRWEMDGIVQPSTSNTLAIVNAQFRDAGDYRVVVTNGISAVTSAVATVTVVADREGPRLLAAIGNNTPPGGGTPFGTNTINVLFSEAVEAASARNTNNYILTRLSNGNVVPLLSILYSTALGALLTVDGSNANWAPGGDYVLTVSGVRDPRGNVIAPGSHVAVSWRHTRNVIQFTDLWRFQDSSIFDPEVFETNWHDCDFVESSWWGDGPAPFCGGLTPPFQLPNPCSDCATPISFQSAPTLFRKWFKWPTNLPTASTTLRLRFAIDDGAVFYLNGVEIGRYNMPRDDVVIATSMAVLPIPIPSCITNFSVAVTNLTSGSNCFAAAVFQAIIHESDTFFGLLLDVDYLRSPSLPSEPDPALAIRKSGGGESQIFWTVGGYALESATNLNLGPASYPVGPWQQVTNMSNPYTIPLDEPQRFFRLKK